MRCDEVQCPNRAGVVLANACLCLIFPRCFAENFKLLLTEPLFARLVMPNALSFLLLLLPGLALCQTSRVQGFSVLRDQRESYILEVISHLNFTSAFSHLHEILIFFAALLLFAGWGPAHASEGHFISRPGTGQRP